MQILTPQPGIKPVTLALGAGGLNHWISPGKSHLLKYFKTNLGPGSESLES